MPFLIILTVALLSHTNLCFIVSAYQRAHFGSGTALPGTANIAVRHFSGEGDWGLERRVRAELHN